MREEMTKNDRLFREKPVWNAIFSLAIPSCITILIMTVYNMADMFFIGQLGDTAQVAAVSVVGPMFSLTAAVATMLGVGGCSVIAGAAGAGKIGDAKTYASLSCYASAGFGIFVAALMFAGTVPVLKILGANEEIIPYAASYMRILAVGTPFMLLSTVLATLLRADGAIKEGLIGNMVGTVLNIVLDPIFVLGLNKGVAGAAVATVLGNMVSTGFYLHYVIKKSTCLSISFEDAKKKPSSLFYILAVGLPNGLSSVLGGFASTFSNRLLVQYGTEAVAAMGAAGKATMVIGMIQMGICMGVQPMMAYNYGAKNLLRLKEILKKLGLLSFTLGLIVAAGSFFAKHALIRMFLKDVTAAAMGEELVVFLLIASPVIGFYYLSTNFLQATGNAFAAAVVSVLRQGLLLIPCLYLMEQLLGFAGIAVAHTIADGASVMIAIAVCFRQYYMLKKRH